MAAAAPASSPMSLASTVQAPTNIAVIKYWGKRDKALNLPINDSLSTTLHIDDLCTKTSVVIAPTLASDRLWLNGKEEDISGNARVLTVLREMRARAVDTTTADGTAVTADQVRGWGIHIVSENNFPTAAGLASSAAGYACMVAALSSAMGIKDSYPGELTGVARQGSGSASRSLDGGFVAWRMGQREDGTDSIAEQVAPEGHWPELRVLVCVVSAARKGTSSTSGMMDSVRTSPSLAHRAAEVVPGRMEQMRAAIAARDFPAFAELAMRDSNSFHATCLDTFPPISYMTDGSRRIVAAVHALNAKEGRTVAGYTFDAGPNAVLYCQEADLPRLARMVHDLFGDGEKTPISNPEVAAAAAAIGEDEAAALSAVAPACPGTVQRLLVTRVGPGPLPLSAAQALADPATGLPVAQ